MARFKVLGTVGKSGFEGYIPCLTDDRSQCTCRSTLTWHDGKENIASATYLSIVGGVNHCSLHCQVRIFTSFRQRFFPG